jgi:hypothetical protein
MIVGAVTRPDNDSRTAPAAATTLQRKARSTLRLVCVYFGKPRKNGCLLLPRPWCCAVVGVVVRCSGCQKKNGGNLDPRCCVCVAARPGAGFFPRSNHLWMDSYEQQRQQQDGPDEKERHSVVVRNSVMMDDGVRTWAAKGPKRKRSETGDSSDGTIERQNNNEPQRKRKRRCDETIFRPTRPIRNLYQPSHQQQTDRGRQKAGRKASLHIITALLFLIPRIVGRSGQVRAGRLHHDWPGRTRGMKLSVSPFASVFDRV